MHKKTEMEQIERARRVHEAAQAKLATAREAAEAARREKDKHQSTSSEAADRARLIAAQADVDVEEAKLSAQIAEDAFADVLLEHETLTGNVDAVELTTFPATLQEEARKIAAVERELAQMREAAYARVTSAQAAADRLNRTRAAEGRPQAWRPLDRSMRAVLAFETSRTVAALGGAISDGVGGALPANPDPEWTPEQHLAALLDGRWHRRSKLIGPTEALRAALYALDERKRQVLANAEQREAEARRRDEWKRARDAEQESDRRRAQQRAEENQKQLEAHAADRTRADEHARRLIGGSHV